MYIHDFKELITIRLYFTNQIILISVKALIYVFDVQREFGLKNVNFVKFDSSYFSNGKTETAL